MPDFQDVENQTAAAPVNVVAVGRRPPPTGPRSFFQRCFGSSFVLGLVGLCSSTPEGGLPQGGIPLRRHHEFLCLSGRNFQQGAESERLLCSTPFEFGLGGRKLLRSRVGTCRRAV